MLLHFIRRFSSHHHCGRILIKDLWDIAPKSNVAISGWVKSIRRHKKVTFLELNDGSSANNLQVVLPAEDFSDENFFYGSAVEMDGELISRPNAKPSIELLCKTIFSNNECNPELYPFGGEWDHPYKYIRQYPHLRPRQRQIASILRIRNKLEMIIHEYFQNNNFVHIHTPAITSSNCEGAGELFTVTSSKDGNDDVNSGGFFGVPAHLTVSGQLHLEACAMGIGNVYTLSPAFRAEKSRPNTHLSEFHMLEVEVGFTKSMEEILCLVENSLRYVISKTLDTCKDDLEFFYGTEEGEKYCSMVKKSATEPFFQLSYGEVLDILNSNPNFFKSGRVEWGDSLNSEHEIFITNYHENRPVFITNFPTHLKPFYVMQNEDSKTSASFDLLFPNCGEMAGGTMREDDASLLERRLDELGLREEYKWYLDLRRFGGLPHGGYGLGFDRLVKFIIGVTNIRDVVPFPRASKVCLL